MRRRSSVRFLSVRVVGSLALLFGGTQAQEPAAASRAVLLDRQGVIRWADTRAEVALFGANYVLPSASDYRAAGYLHADRKRMIEEDMAHFARLGWDGLRLTFWGDWEASDSAGNLVANDHLDLLDWLIARARERGIYMLFSPIQLYNANWPDALDDTTSPGFGRRFSRERMGTDPAAIRAQVTYLRHILGHVNPYTGVALKDEPAILFIELVNEPVHHPEDVAGSVRYIDTLTDAVRRAGCHKLVFYNVSQDFRIGEAIRRSRAQGVSFGWYPTGLNAGHELRGNYLRGVDEFPDMLRPELARLPRIVYEFDSPDLRNATMYPAMVRTFRRVGAQFAAMFAYDMLRTASRNLGWQTHYLNLVYTPRKAMSTVIAAEAMRRLPRLRDYGRYPRNTRFGDFRISAEEDLAELVADDAFLYAGPTRSVPTKPDVLRRVAGYGSSPIVAYEGQGIYFLDRVENGLWRLEVYPDAVPIRDPFEPPAPEKVVTRAIARTWPMTVRLPDLGESFVVQPIAAGNPRETRAAGGLFPVRPGVYLLSSAGPVDLSVLPKRIGPLGMAEYYAPTTDLAQPAVTSLAQPSYLRGRGASIVAQVADSTPTDSVLLYLRPAAGGSYRAFPMAPAGAYHYAAVLPTEALPEGRHDFAITTFRGRSARSFPGGSSGRPGDWSYLESAPWTFDVVGARTTLRLFDPATDVSRLAFTRIGDAGRRGLFRVVLAEPTGRPAFHLALPVDSSGRSPADYTASLTVVERVRAREETIARGRAIRLRLRGLGLRQVLRVTLMEDDGTSWTSALTVGRGWTEAALPLAGFAIARGVKLPQGFPGEWNYWVAPAEGRGGRGDRPRLKRLERLELSLRRADGKAITPEGYGVELEWVNLDFGVVPAAGEP
jgi:hypothetical protein